MRRLLLAVALLWFGTPEAGAWPVETMTALGRDARRLLPRSLATLLGEREPQIQDELARMPRDLALALGEDQRAGTLRPDTIEAVDAEVGRAVQLLREKRVSEGLVRLGGLLRITADLSDPLLAVDGDGWPPGLAREYYALFTSNMEKMPVVLDLAMLCPPPTPSEPTTGQCSERAVHGVPKALELSRRQLPALWQSLLDRSRSQVPTIRGELFRGGRVVSHARLDYRSPAWAMASLAYSRAVTATAATWLTAWREARGDITGPVRPRVVAPREEARGSLADHRRSSLPEAP